MGDAWKHAMAFCCSFFSTLTLLLLLLLMLLLLLLLLPLLLLLCRGNVTRSLAACISITAFLSQSGSGSRAPYPTPRKAFLGFLQPSRIFLWIFNLHQARAVLFYTPLPRVFVVLRSRAFTQIHCFNLLKFVDRKQKLINVWQGYRSMR